MPLRSSLGESSRSCEEEVKEGSPQLIASPPPPPQVLGEHASRRQFGPNYAP
ncbi:hypothetical protein CC2G_009759 [Coprinopsis cinerea AmutBmut pab1-1]|nr:hypothetical protein CC2G_009759 [Coprinopsis cinerea AmutBmut pab1-1]